MDKLQELQRLMAHGHCAESQTDIHNTHGDMRKLVQCYFYYIRQCIQKGFPSLDYMRRYLGAEAAKYGGFIDAQGEIVPRRDMAFVGNSNCQFTATGYNIHRIWLQDNSGLLAVATDHSHLHIDCFGVSRLVVRVVSPTARVYVNLYGNSRCEAQGKYACNVISTMHNQETY